MQVRHHAKCENKPPKHKPAMRWSANRRNSTDKKHHDADCHQKKLALRNKARMSAMPVEQLTLAIPVSYTAQYPRMNQIVSSTIHPTRALAIAVVNHGMAG